MSRAGRRWRLLGAHLVGWAVLGAVLGVVWHQVWTPYDGIVYEGEWFLQPAGPDFAFDGPALFALIGAPAGLLASSLVALFVRRDELLTLAAITLGSFVAAWVMFTVGHALGPADPRDVIAGVADFERLPAALDVGTDSGWAPFDSTVGLAIPVGALLGQALILLVCSPPGRPRDGQADLDMVESS